MFFCQAPIEAEPTSLPNPHGILTTRPGPNGKSGLHSQWLPFLVSPGAQNGQTTLLERGTPWPAIGAGSQQRTLSIKTSRFFVKSLPLN